MTLARPDLPLGEFKNLILLKEQSLLAHFPKTSSGRKMGGPTQAQPRARSTYHSYDSDDEIYHRSSIRDSHMARSTMREPQCSICRGNHMARDCKDAYWCDKCRWMHKNNDLCDEGVSKRDWYKIKENRDAQFAKVGGGAMNRR